MMVVFDDCSKGRYVRTAVESGNRQKVIAGLKIGPGGAPLAMGSVSESKDGSIQLRDVSYFSVQYIKNGALINMINT